jgi:hypothetical protein
MANASSADSEPSPAFAPDRASRDDYRTQMQRDGYATIPNVLSRDEVERLRSACRTHLRSNGTFFGLGMVQPNAAVHLDALEWVFHHDGILDAVRSVAGREDIVFTGHCDAHLNLTGDWHKDTGGGRYMKDDYFEDDACQIYKVGIYLQDHRENGGLTVRSGSHRSESMDDGPVEYCGGEAGSVTIFDVRLTHRGERPDPVEDNLFKVWQRIPLIRRNKKAYYHLRESINHARGQDDRVAIFFTFGAPNEHTEHFARENMRRQVEQTGTDQTTLPSSLVETLQSKGVQIAEAVRP